LRGRGENRGREESRGQRRGRGDLSGREYSGRAYYRGSGEYRGWGRGEYEHQGEVSQTPPRRGCSYNAVSPPSFETESGFGFYSYSEDRYYARRCARDYNSVPPPSPHRHGTRATRADSRIITQDRPPGSLTTTASESSSSMASSLQPPIGGSLPVSVGRGFTRVSRQGRQDQHGHHEPLRRPTTAPSFTFLQPSTLPLDLPLFSSRHNVQNISFDLADESSPISHPTLSSEEQPPVLLTSTTSESSSSSSTFPYLQSVGRGTGRTRWQERPDRHEHPLRRPTTVQEAATPAPLLIPRLFSSGHDVQNISVDLADESSPNASTNENSAIALVSPSIM